MMAPLLSMEPGDVESVAITIRNHAPGAGLAAHS